MKRTRSVKCPGKNQYATHGEAAKALRAFRARTVGGIETNASVYPCGNHYHWGHYRNRKK